MLDIYTLLEEHSIAYTKTEHEAVFTCGDAEKKLRDDLPGAHTKNLFLRDRKGRRHFLVVVGYEKNVDLTALREILEVSKLGFASDERLLKYLGVTPGAVTLLGLVNDTEHAVELIIDEALWNAEEVLCHPLVNTATLSIPHAGIEKFLEVTGHKAMVIDVPNREDS